MTDNCSVQLLSWYSVSDPYSVVEFNQLDEKLYDKVNHSSPVPTPHLHSTSSIRVNKCDLAHDSTSIYPQGSGDHCVIGLRVSRACNESITVITVASEAPTVELYDGVSGEYLLTVRGRKDVDAVPDDDDIVCYWCVAVLEKALPAVRIKIFLIHLSLIASTIIKSSRLHPSPGIVDLDQVHHTVEGFGSKMSDNAKSLMTLLEAFQQFRLKSVGGNPRSALGKISPSNGISHSSGCICGAPVSDSTCGLSSKSLGSLFGSHQEGYASGDGCVSDDAPDTTVMRSGEPRSCHLSDIVQKAGMDVAGSTVPGVMPACDRCTMPGEMPVCGRGMVPGVMPTCDRGTVPGVVPTCDRYTMPGEMPVCGRGMVPGVMPTCDRREALNIYDVESSPNDRPLADTKHDVMSQTENIDAFVDNLVTHTARRCFHRQHPYEVELASPGVAQLMTEMKDHIILHLEKRLAEMEGCIIRCMDERLSITELYLENKFEAFLSGVTMSRNDASL